VACLRPAIAVPSRASAAPQRCPNSHRQTAGHLDTWGRAWPPSSLAELERARLFEPLLEGDLLEGGLLGGAGDKSRRINSGLMDERGVWPAGGRPLAALRLAGLFAACWRPIEKEGQCGRPLGLAVGAERAEFGPVWRGRHLGKFGGGKFGRSLCASGSNFQPATVREIVQKCAKVCKCVQKCALVHERESVQSAVFTQS